MECVIGLYKTECIRTTGFHTGPYRTIGEVEHATAGWIEWYNTRRLHSSLEMMTPVEFEQTPTRNPHPRAATRVGAAENLGRFRAWNAHRVILLIQDLQITVIHAETDTRSGL